MAFTKSTVATNNISALANKPLESALTLKQKFDQYGIDDKARFNLLVDELEATTGTSGAENIGSKTISGVTGNTVHAQITDLKAQQGTLDNNNVKLTGNQTVEGIKTFTSSPIVPTPTTDFQASTRKFVTDSVMGIVVPTLPEGAVTNEFLSDEIKMIGTVKTPTISYGQNIIANENISHAYPDITFQGQSYVNLLGTDGNCEDVSKWNAYNCTLALDATHKVFGANGIKLTATVATGGNAYVIKAIDFTKYWLLSGFVKNGNATIGVNLLARGNGTGYVQKTTSLITSTSAFVRQAMKFSPSEFGTGCTQIEIDVILQSVSGQYAYFDGIILTEITATEYANDSEAVLMARYPYIDSYACLQNPSVEVIHDNMVRNGNGEEGVAWWNNTGALVNVSSTGVFQLTTTDASHTLNQVIKVKPNTDYQLKCICAGTGSPKIRILSPDESIVLINTATGGTFNSGALTEIIMHMQDLTTGSHVNNFSEIHLIPGTVAPTYYKPQRREQCVIEGKFATGDTVSLKEGKLEGKVKWKHKVLYGRDYGWGYSSDGAGFKVIRMASPLGALTGDNSTLIKGDGKVIAYSASITASDQFVANSSSYLYLGVSDADSGWTETLAPNANAVKAGENGWKANANNGTVYTSWISKVDGSAPTTNSEAFVSANVAPLYKGTRLHYKLANPESVGLSARLKGKVPKLEQGWNVVNVDAGVVIGEVANPQQDGANGFFINNKYETVINSLLSYASESMKVFRNKVIDALWVQSGSTWGNGRSYLAPVASFDPKAQYTVDYTILRTKAPVVGTPSLAYTPGVTKKINPDIEPIRMIDMPVTPSPDDLMEGDIVTVWGTSPVVVKRKRLGGLI